MICISMFVCSISVWAFRSLLKSICIYQLRYDTLFIKQVLRGVVGVQRANCNYGRTDGRMDARTEKKSVASCLKIDWPAKKQRLKFNSMRYKARKDKSNSINQLLLIESYFFACRIKYLSSHSLVQGVHEKLCFFHNPLHSIPRLHIAARDSQSNESVQSLLLAGNIL